MTTNRLEQCIAMSFFFLSTISFASSPLLNIVPVFKAPLHLARNSFTAAVYQVTNNTKTLTAFKMQTIPGVTQVTSLTGACADIISLGYGQSCLLNLRIMGNQIPAQIKQGPVICNNSPTPFGCSQPSAANSINITATLADSTLQNTWISVLVAQEQPPNDIQTYVNQIIALAPKAEQIHLRVEPGETNYTLYANLINLLRTAYGTSLQIGFHPDNSNSSYSGWGCSTSECVLNASITTMNAMNAVADPKKIGLGFNIFSLEQGYVEITPADPAHFQAVKACLNPAVATSTCPVCSTCTPTTAIASPVVTFGNVSQSYGAGIYGPNMLDYGYPQYYNLGKRLAPYDNLITDSYFPTYSTSCLGSPPYSSSLNVVDVDSSSAYAPEIPCLAQGQTSPNVFTYPDPSTGDPSPTLAAAYVGYLMTQYPPISNIIDTDGSTVYITFSGEPEFFGASGWTYDLMAQFYQDLNNSFTQLYGLYPPPDPMFASGIFASGVDPTQLKYAIWNFSSILANNA